MCLLDIIILCGISCPSVGREYLFCILCHIVLYFCHISLFLYFFLVIQTCPDPNTQFLVALLLHTVPLRHSTKISLLQIFSLILSLFVIIKSNGSWLFKLVLMMKMIACPDPNIFVPTLTPLFSTLYFTQKVFFQNSKHLRQFFIVLGYTHMRYIAKMFIDIRDKNFYKTCD